MYFWIWQRHIRRILSGVNKHSCTHMMCCVVLAGILGALVPCCLDLSLAHQYGECLCMPLLPGSTFAIRVGIRERYKIRVSVCLCVCRYTVCCTVVRASLKTEEGKFVKMDPVHNTIKFSMKQKLHHRTQFLVLWRFSHF